MSKSLPLNVTTRNLIARRLFGGIPMKQAAKIERLEALATEKGDSTMIARLRELVADAQAVPNRADYFADRRPLLATSLYVAGTLVAGGVGYMAMGEWGLVLGIVAGAAASFTGIMLSPPILGKLQEERALARFLDQAPSA